MTAGVEKGRYLAFRGAAAKTALKALAILGETMSRIRRYSAIRIALNVAVAAPELGGQEVAQRTAGADSAAWQRQAAMLVREYRATVQVR